MENKAIRSGQVRAANSLRSELKDRALIDTQCNVADHCDRLCEFDRYSFVDDEKSDANIDIESDIRCAISNRSIRMTLSAAISR